MDRFFEVDIPLIPIFRFSLWFTNYYNYVLKNHYDFNLPERKELLEDDLNTNTYNQQIETFIAERENVVNDKDFTEPCDYSDKMQELHDSCKGITISFDENNSESRKQFIMKYRKLIEEMQRDLMYQIYESQRLAKFFIFANDSECNMVNCDKTSLEKHNADSHKIDFECNKVSFENISCKFAMLNLINLLIHEEQKNGIQDSIFDNGEINFINILVVEENKENSINFFNEKKDISSDSDRITDNISDNDVKINMTDEMGYEKNKNEQTDFKNSSRFIFKKNTGLDFKKVFFTGAPFSRIIKNTKISNNVYQNTINVVDQPNHEGERITKMEMKSGFKTPELANISSQSDQNNFCIRHNNIDFTAILSSKLNKSNIKFVKPQKVESDTCFTKEFEENPGYNADTINTYSEQNFKRFELRGVNDIGYSNRSFNKFEETLDLSDDEDEFFDAHEDHL